MKNKVERRLFAAMAAKIIAERARRAIDAQWLRALAREMERARKASAENEYASISDGLQIWSPSDRRAKSPRLILPCGPIFQWLADDLQRAINDEVAAERRLYRLLSRNMIGGLP